MTATTREFAYHVDPDPEGFTVSATADRTPVTVSLRQWAFRLSAQQGNGIGLIRTRHLFDEIAAGLLLDWTPRDGRRPSDRYREWARKRAARVIHHRVLTEVKQLLSLVPDEVITTQRAVFAATYQTGAATRPELYRPEYAMLRRDIRRYRAAAAALTQSAFLVRQASIGQVKHSPEYAAVTAMAGRAGLKVTLGEAELWGAAEISYGPVFDRLAADWLGLFSPSGQPYTPLSRTLMNLPGGVPAGLLRYLAGFDLPRPVIDRVELLALLTAFSHMCGHERARKHLHLFTHAGRTDILRAMGLVSAATHVSASARRTVDIARTVAYLCDYPDEHRGNVVGLARKAVRWHQAAIQREAAATVERLGGDQAAALPPTPLPGVAGVEFLGTVARIAEEGAAMGNCVASYAESAVTGQCYLFHVEHGGEMATVEVALSGQVSQAEGPRNKPNAAARWGRRQLSQWDDAPDWKHEDGQPVIREEVDTLRLATLGEIRAVRDLSLAETDAQLARSLGEPASILEGKRS